MKPAPKLKEEAERLQNLRSYEVLDTSPELLYDDITVLASAICGVPIALVSLLDSDRQWFKSRVGLDASETPRDISFCGHVIEGRELFEVPNALEDPRFADNPLVAGAPDIRFYAGAPLITPEGHAVGTLCVIDRRPRKLEPEQKRALVALARQVVALLEMRKVNARLARGLREAQEARSLVERQQVTLVQSAKMAALGAMAAGVAHEINNPLTIISGKASLLAEQLKKGPVDPKRLSDGFEVIEKTAIRIAKIVQGLRSFSRQEAVDPMHPVDMRAVIDDTLSLCRERFQRGGVQLEVDTAGRGPIMVNGRPGQISQVLLNLLQNSFDAVQEVERRWVTIRIEENEREAILEVIDSGKGVPVEHRHRLWEPFFTTKPVGQGTGLGLSISNGITQAHGGVLELDEESSNTCFRVRLPKAPSAG